MRVIVRKYISWVFIKRIINVVWFTATYQMHYEPLLRAVDLDINGDAWWTIITKIYYRIENLRSFAIKLIVIAPPIRSRVWVVMWSYTCQAREAMQQIQTCVCEESWDHLVWFATGKNCSTVGNRWTKIQNSNFALGPLLFLWFYTIEEVKSNFWNNTYY